MSKQSALLPAKGHSFFSVSAVTSRIQEILQPAIGKQFWLKAEISSGRERGGHFYCNLVETGDDGKIIAQLSCRIWRQSFDKIKAKFKQNNLTPDFSDGTVAGLQCSLSFHPQWGISLDVTDADTSVALGELELRKQAILERLQKEGLFEPNKLLSVPFLPIRIGLITSSGSAACQDFLETIQKSGFGFQIFLADATVQGDNTEKTVLRALDTLEQLNLDLVVIIRGGGSKTDLSYMDNEAIARRIAKYKIPVWTGIGHEIDMSVLDYVANRFFKTPTAVADNIVSIFTELQRYLEGAKHHLKTSWAFNLRREKTWLNDAYIGLRQGTKKMLKYHISMLQSQGLRLSLDI
jgi:exodeoxyribonuclease VII large subunit